MEMSFQEKSTWSQLVGLVLVFGYYFYRVLATSLTNTETVVLFIVAIVALVALQIVFHIIAALSNIEDANQGEDERDTLITLKATRVGAVVLGIGAMLSASLWIFNVTPLMMANAILLSLVIAEVTQNILQIAYYRRGV